MKLPRGAIAVQMPPDVYYVRAKGKLYFYHMPGRGTKTPGKRTSLGSDPRALWDVFEQKIGKLPELEPQARDFAAMVAAYKASPKWNAYSAATQRDYAYYLDRLVELWGPLNPREISPAGVLAYRDTMADRPIAANHMVTVGRTLCKWAIPRDWLTTNPFREIEPLQVEDDGHWPWPDWAVDHVLTHAWSDLARAVYLLVETGQRESDVVRMESGWLEGRGIRVRPQKTRKKRRGAFWVPLTTAAVARIARWKDEPLAFTGGRWGKPLWIATPGVFVLSPAGSAYAPDGLRARWGRWLRTAEGAALLKRWAAWERRIRERDQMSIDQVMRPTLHGLRATAVVRRRLAGYSNEQVSNDIGMSLQMVTRYSRFIDQASAAEKNIILLERSARG